MDIYDPIVFQGNIKVWQVFPVKSFDTNADAA